MERMNWRTWGIEAFNGDHINTFFFAWILTIVYRDLAPVTWPALDWYHAVAILWVVGWLPLTFIYSLKMHLAGLMDTAFSEALSGGESE